MRHFKTSSQLLHLLTITSSVALINGAALSIEDHDSAGAANHLVERECANPCGFYNQACCASGESCYTDASNQAQCGPAGHDEDAPQQQGDWQYYTTTYILTDFQTITTTISSFFPVETQNLAAPTVAPGHPGCTYSLGEQPCGDKCCSAGQYCIADTNECGALDGGSSAWYGSFQTVVQTASVPQRPTSNTVFTVTSTGLPTTTVPYQVPLGTDGSALISVESTTTGGGLSSGAIAGIVIGVIAGIIILLLICLCCCAKGAIQGIAGIFRRDKGKRRTDTTYIEERRTHHGSRQSKAGRTWFGSRPARPDREKTGGGFGGVAKVGAGLGTMAMLLGLKRKRDRKNEAKSDSSYSQSGDYYLGTSESSLSSDRRTRDSRKMRR